MLDRAGTFQQQNSVVQNDIQQAQQNFYVQPTQSEQQQHTAYSTNSVNINVIKKNFFLTLFNLKIKCLN